MPKGAGFFYSSYAGHSVPVKITDCEKHHDSDPKFILSDGCVSWTLYGIGFKMKMALAHQLSRDTGHSGDYFKNSFH